jgi:hypothetical protein
MKNIFFIIFVIPLFLAGSASAQKNELGIFLGSAGYHGDIGRDYVGGVLSEQSPAMGFIYKINFHKYLSFRSSVQYGTIKANDAEAISIERQNRNLRFQSRIIDMSLGFEFNFYKFLARPRRQTSSPYLYAGLSYFTFNPQAKNSMDILVDLQSLGTEGQGTNATSQQKYNLSSWAIPFGFGYKTNFGKNISLGIEWIWRAGQTDYLDDVSSYYADEMYLSVESAEMANPGVNQTIVGKTRGNPNNKDWYHFTGITLSYKIKNKPLKCPKELLP